MPPDKQGFDGSKMHRASKESFEQEAGAAP
jgi:hypothetical protein